MPQNRERSWRPVRLWPGDYEPVQGNVPSREALRAMFFAAVQRFAPQKLDELAALLPLYRRLEGRVDSHSGLDTRPRAVTMPAACRELGISVSLGYELAAAGTFSCRIIRAGRRIVVPRAELDRILGVTDQSDNNPSAA